VTSLRRLRRGAVGALLLFVCSNAGAAQPAHRIFQVRIDKMAFGRTPADARVGDLIDWVNADFLRHTATAADRSFDLDLAPGAHARLILRKPGKVAFRCRYHPSMTGVLVIAR
jgi:plastocyanin